MTDRALSVSLLALCAAGLSACQTARTETGGKTAAAAPASVPATLIPRKAIFGNPVRNAGQISPDGRHVSWLAPVNGIMNVWVAPTDRIQAERAVTKETRRPLAQYFWAPDGKHILYLQDEGGNENFHVHSVDIATGKDTDLTPVAKDARAFVQGVSRLRPDTILVALNDRDRRYPDLYEIDYRTGTRKLVAQNSSYSTIVTDREFRPVFATRAKPGGGTEYFRRTASGDWQPAFELEADDAQTTNPVGFNRAGTHLYWIDSRGRDTAALVRTELATGRSETLASNPRANIGNILFDPVTYEPIAYNVNYTRGEWHPLGGGATADLALLNERFKGQEYGITSITDDGSKAVVVSNAAEQPAVFWLYDRRARTLTHLFNTRPDLDQYDLQPMHPVVISSRDDKNLVSYLTLPPGTDPDGDGVPSRPVPMVLTVHGGPWARDAYGFNATHQWLANRGYAVLSVNYRGSTGFGKNFVNAAVGEWSGKMHDDLVDAVNWAVRRRIADKEEVAIMGGSYGGYATLVGLTFTPELFECGVDIVGPSNLKTLMESFPAYWRPALANTFYRHIGDPADPKQVARIMAQSPISRVDKIRAPLLIGQGGNDPRVVKAESDQIVEAMKARGLPVTYVNYPDEGHGFLRPENRLSFNAITEGFLAQCLGGRYEPIGDDFRGASLQILEGREHIRGLPPVATAGTD
jgi:dipeptidyl aminopeptidase/acylaminoacyl peptidase